MDVFNLVKILIFVVVSIGFIPLTRISWLEDRRRGVFRFLAWEAILVLVLLNSADWFNDPFSPFQILSWLMLFGSLFLAVEGFRLLRSFGKTTGGIDGTTTLVAVGVYHYIRHPLYASLLLVGLGAFLKRPSVIGGFISLALVVFLTLTARIEETENKHKFGEDYGDYMRRTKMFIPFLL